MSKYNFVDCIDIVGNTVNKFDDLKLYISTGAINFNTIDYTKIEKVSYIDKPSRANLEVKSGDVLFAKMQNTKKTFIIDNITKDYIYSTGFYAVRPKSDILSKECLYYILSSNSFLLQKDKNCSGTTQKAITNNGLKKIEVTIPDLSIQNKIVNKLQVSDKIISLLRNIIFKFDQLVKAKFVEMFGSIENNLYSYPTATLKEVCNKITDGTHKTPNYQSQGITFISAKNIIDGKLDFNNVKFITNDEYQIIQNRCQTELNDVLMSKSGTLGTVALVDTDIPLGLFESLAVIKYKRNLLSGEFLYEQLRSNSIQYQLLNKVKGIAIKHLHLNVIGEIKIILPPIELQNKFANFVNQVNKSKSTVKKCLEKAELLKSALTQKYFN